VVTVRIENLGFSYKSHPVFAGIDVSINKGEVVSIVGKNGAGKSTLLKCINRVLKPSCGTVYLDSHDIAKLSLRCTARKIGYLSQKNENLFSATVFETVLAGRYPHSPLRFTKRDEEVVAKTLSAMGLGEFAQRTFDHLSGGEQQQVLIARALAQRADVLLFDEPTNSLDLRHQLDIMQAIHSVAQNKGITTVVAIHDLNLAAAFSDRIIVVHEKKIFAVGKPSEVLTFETLKKVFGVDVKGAGGNFTDGDLVWKVKFTVQGAVDNGETREAIAFKRNATYFGLKSADLGRTFRSGGNEFKIVGLNTRAKRFPILAVSTADGRGFKFPADQVRAFLAVASK